MARRSKPTIDDKLIDQLLEGRELTEEAYDRIRHLAPTILGLS